MESDAPAAAPLVCPYCHQPILPSYYFCPNCGNKLSSAPLSTSIATQTWIYAFSAILPMLCFLFISKWPGIKYYRSKDPTTKNIGSVAILILVVSTVLTVWFAYLWTQEFIQSQVSSINADMSEQG